MSVIDTNHAILAVLFLGVAFIKLRHRQMEHFFTNFVCGVWFLFTFFDTSMPVETVRQTSTSFIIILLAIEWLSPMFRWYWRRQK